jgi:hypothetical protein
MAVRTLTGHLPSRSNTRVRPRPNWQAGGELLLIVVAFFVYFGVRGLVIERVPEAEANAVELISLEKSLGIFKERDLQDLVLPHDWLRKLANGVYLYGHGPVIAVLAVALYARRRGVYLLTRNAFLLSGAIGLVLYTMVPVAPPRLMPGFGFEDTVLQEYHVRRVLMPGFLTNEYAAVPSLHFGWNLLIGAGVWSAFKHPLARVFAVATPVAMLLAIVVTANHYFLDAVAGGAVALAGAGLAIGLQKAGQQHVGGGAARESVRWLLGVAGEGDAGVLRRRERQSSAAAE